SGYEDVFTEEGKHRMGDFLSYVNNNTLYPVTIKYKNSSGRHEFFRFHHSHLNIAISNLSIDDPSKKVHVVDECTINFSVRCDFNTAGLYVYLSNNDNIFDVELEGEHISDMDFSEMIPVVTPQQLYTNRTLPNGWQVFTTPSFDIDTDDIPYPLDFSS